MIFRAVLLLVLLGLIQAAAASWQECRLPECPDLHREPCSGNTAPEAALALASLHGARQGQEWEDSQMFLAPSGHGGTGWDTEDAPTISLEMWVHGGGGRG